MVLYVKLQYVIHGLCVLAGAVVGRRGSGDRRKDV
jgi:hypothetical protein